MTKLEQKGEICCFCHCIFLSLLEPECNVMGNWTGFVNVHLVGRVYVHCCNVFSKFCMCTVNVVLSLSMLFSGIAMVQPLML